MFSFIFIFLNALIFPGIIGMTKNKLSGRKGPGYFQPLRDILRLLKKESIFSEHSSFVTQIAPTIYFLTIICAIFIIPFNGHEGLIFFEGDFVVFAYLLALGKFFMILMAMDAASSFQGMGANRESLFSMLVEPAFFLILASFALLTGETSFHSIYHHLHFDSYLSYLVAGLAAYLIVQIVMIENSRMPVDDPKTHLELTMIHEVMVLDICGFDLALIQFASALKFSLYGALIANFFMPDHWSFLSKAGLFFLIQMILAVSIGVFESFSVRNKMDRNPQYILTLSSIALLLFFSILILMPKS